MINVKRIKKKFQPDHSRVIIKPHIPVEKDRVERIIKRVLSLSEEKAKQELDRVIASFSNRHKNIWDAFDKNYNEIKKYIPKNIIDEAFRKYPKGFCVYVRPENIKSSRDL